MNNKIEQIWCGIENRIADAIQIGYLLRTNDRRIARRLSRESKIRFVCMPDTRPRSYAVFVPFEVSIQKAKA